MIYFFGSWLIEQLIQQKIIDILYKILLPVMLQLGKDRSKYSYSKCALRPPREASRGGDLARSQKDVCFTKTSYLLRPDATAQVQKTGSPNIWVIAALCTVLQDGRIEALRFISLFCSFFIFFMILNHQKFQFWWV